MVLGSKAAVCELGLLLQTRAAVRFGSCHHLFSVVPSLSLLLSLLAIIYLLRTAIAIAYNCNLASYDHG